ncbi:hypothetical protein Tco_0654510 [Tanacetum coccineum]|uniref:Uncharacterized protein n=1 Tax=Tanacetum coccineum TaxID=301880 RepID=A0ABQ4X3E4_9ASTR
MCRELNMGQKTDFHTALSFQKIERKIKMIQWSEDIQALYHDGYNKLRSQTNSSLELYEIAFQLLAVPVVLNYADVETDNLDVRDRVYAANRGDMEATLHMLGQLEVMIADMEEFEKQHGGIIKTMATRRSFRPPDEYAPAIFAQETVAYQCYLIAW